MIRPLRALLPLLVLMTAACAGPTAVTEPGLTLAASSDVDPSRQILVTFADRGLERPPSAGPGQYVSRAADYQSTAWSRGVSAELARDYSLVTLTEWPIRTLGIHCVVFGVREDEPIDDLMRRLAKDRRVGAVQRMNTFHALVGDDPYRKLQTALGGLRLGSVHQWSTGRDVRIAVIDTGVDVGHPDLAGQVAEHEDMAEGRGDFEDDIHGTAVAGVIAALSGNGQGIVGVAPGSKLFALRACWPERPGEVGAVCNSLTLAKALDTAIHLKPNILNLSLTGPPDPLVEALLKAAVDAEIIVVAAEPDAREAPGFARRVQGMLRVLAADEPAPGGAETATWPMLAAPGHEVLTTFPHGTYNFISGSSFAAANVSGAIALLLELQPGLSARQAADLLGAPRRLRPVSSRGSLVGIDVCAAVARLRPGTPCTDAGPGDGLQASSPSPSRYRIAER